MIAIVLAGGYGKRLWPLTYNIAKPLLPVAGKPIIDYLIEKIMPMGSIVSEVWVLTNERFKGQLEEWAEKRPLKIKVVSDGSSFEEEKPGAVGALAKIAPLIDRDFLVAAGDCIYEDDLGGFLTFFMRERKPTIAVYRAVELDQVKRGSEVLLNPNGRVISFVEKPKTPSTNLTGAAIYAFPDRIKSRILEYVELRLPRDEPGRFIEWLHRVEEVYGYMLRGNVWDIGTREAYARASQLLMKRGAMRVDW